MFVFTAFVALAISKIVSASPPADRSPRSKTRYNHDHHGRPFDHFVVFGDSYTDAGMGSYFKNHGDEPPPPGVLPDETAVNAGGGLTWPQFVGNYTRSSIYDYASGGATCSNEIVARFDKSKGRDIPSVLEDQIPKYESDIHTKLYKHINPANTVYGLWIGTNDLGFDAFLTDSQAPKADLTTYIDCVWSIFDHIYKAGGRRFVLLNNNALQLAPYYQDPSEGGIGSDQTCNMTETNQKMLEYTMTTNRLLDYGAPFHLIIKRRWPHATFAVYNVHDLIIDIYGNPQQYLEAPFNVKGFYNDCPTGECPQDRNLNGYLWYDALHPSNKTDSIIAKEFIKVTEGKSKYGTQWSS